MIKYSGYAYRCSANETFDSVALTVYGDEKYAPDLMNANPGLCGLTVFEGGEVLLLPALDIPKHGNERKLANMIAPWRV